MKLPAFRLRRRARPPEAAADATRPTRPWERFTRLPARRELGELLRHNRGLKVVSLLLACFLWYSINALERDAERLIDLPISIRKIPPDLIVTTPPTKPVTVTIRGPRTILDSVDETKTRLVVDLSAITPGEHRVDLATAAPSPELPRRIKAVRMQPARLGVTVERLAIRRLPVRIDLAGAPALGYMLGTPSATPDHVEVSGPANKVTTLTEIRTEPLDLHGAASRLQRTVLLEFVGDYVTVVPDRVRIAVDVEEVVVSREFRKVPVVVRGGSARLEPSTVDLTVEGPQRLLHGWRPPEGSVVVEAGGLGPGEHRLPPQVELPPGLEAMAVVPDTIRVHVDARGGG